MARQSRLAMALPFTLAVARPFAGGPNRAVVHTNNAATVHTNSNWDNTYWHSNRYGYWNGQHGYWRLVGDRHVFVVVN
jgi:hypothetical protein